MTTTTTKRWYARETCAGAGQWYIADEGDGNGKTVALVYTTEADAKLIEAAPKLLAALKNLLAGPNWPGARMTARNIIAEIEGGK